MTRTVLGIERALADTTLLGDGPFALLSNYTATLPDLTLGVDALLAAGVPFAALITPEHGFWGAAQAGESDGAGTWGEQQVPMLDAYLVEGEALDALLARALPEGGTLLVDLQDVGVRFYTYTWSMFDLMCSAARLGIRVLVLDRPNPLGGAAHGPGLDPTCSSFVGRVGLPSQHGLTIGELALWFAAVHVPAATGSEVRAEVVELDHWRRQRFPDTGLRWVMPSPNLPTFDSAQAYPATCLIEGTVLSEGRGTTRPFEILGAPWLDGRWARTLRGKGIPGVEFRDVVFRPTFSKCAEQTCRGVQLYVTEADEFDPIRTGWELLSTLAELYPDHELWRQRGPGIDGARPPFIDLLWGSDSLRTGIDAGRELDQIIAAAPAPDPIPDQIRKY